MRWVALATLGGGSPRGQVLCDPPCATLVRSPDELQPALAAARPGSIIEIPGNLTLDLDAVIPLEITDGVTLQSSRGAPPRSAAARDRIRKSTALYVTGRGVTIRGLTLPGPWSGTEKTEKGMSGIRVDGLVSDVM